MAHSIPKQMILSGILGGVTMALYLVLGNFLDPRIGFEWSNIVSVLIAYSLDFFIQQMVFLGKLANHSRFIWKFIVQIIVELVATQILFDLVIKYIKTHHPTFYQQKLKGKWVTLIRCGVTSIIFICITFHLRKYFVFV